MKFEPSLSLKIIFLSTSMQYLNRDMTEENGVSNTYMHLLRPFLQGTEFSLDATSLKDKAYLLFDFVSL